MKQLNLTDRQKEIISQLENAFKAAQEENLSFVYDICECSLCAYNSANVSEAYSGRYAENPEDEEMDWDNLNAVSFISFASIDFFDYGRQDYYLKFG